MALRVQMFVRSASHTNAAKRLEKFVIQAEVRQVEASKLKSRSCSLLEAPPELHERQLKFRVSILIWIASPVKDSEKSRRRTPTTGTLLAGRVKDSDRVHQHFVWDFRLSPDRVKSETRKWRSQTKAREWLLQVVRYVEERTQLITRC